MKLCEFVMNDGLSQQSDGVIKDVLVLGTKSKNGRTYTTGAMKNAVALYEGAAVYNDHPTKADKERGGRAAADRFGNLQNVRFVEGVNGPQLRGDLVYLTTHPLAVQLSEAEQRKLPYFGLSHLADGTFRQDATSKTVFIESIDTVTEVDLVTNPATATSLREQEEALVPEEPTKEEKAAEERDWHADQALQSGILAIVKDPNTTMEEKAAKIQALFAAHLEVHGGEEEEEEEPAPEPTPAAEQAATLTASINALSEQVKSQAAELKALKESTVKLAKRKYLPGPHADPDPVALALAEQTQTPAVPNPSDKEAFKRFLYSRD